MITLLEHFTMKPWTMKSQPEETKSIELDLSDDVLLKLAMQAHERNVTLNTHIIDVIKDKLKDTEYQFENGDKPQLLTERQT